MGLLTNEILLTGNTHLGSVNQIKKNRPEVGVTKKPPQGRAAKKSVVCMISAKRVLAICYLNA
jgi:hypothetical protein